MKPLLLDLYCGAGGTSMGYYHAGFDVIGIDNVPQRNFPFELIVGDALDESLWPAGVSVIHASPPCHQFSRANRFRTGHTGWMLDDGNQLRRCADRLLGREIPVVIENVEGAPMPFAPWQGRLCGSSFGLDVRRHRRFISNRDLGPVPPCDHAWQTPRFRSLDPRRDDKQLAAVVTVAGHCNYDGEYELRCKAMGIDWMVNAELTQAIPPPYTEHLGRQLLGALVA